MQTAEWNLWANLFMLAQFLMVLIVGLRVMLTRHPPGSSFAWLLITAALPVAGFLLYLFILCLRLVFRCSFSCLRFLFRYGTMLGKGFNTLNFLFIRFVIRILLGLQFFDTRVQHIAHQVGQPTYDIGKPSYYH